MVNSLIDEREKRIICPRCEEAQPMRDFSTLGMSPRYAWLLAPIYRCKQCNHLFAPRHLAQPVMEGLGPQG